MADTGEPVVTERRPLAAGHVLVVGLVCLSVWTVLNAEALERSAETSALGRRRSAALAFLRPVSRVTALLGLDRPRHVLDRALGRTTRAPSPEIAPEPEPAAPEPGPPPFAAMRRPVPGQPVRMWIGGDSMAEAFGNALVRAAVGSGAYDTHLDYQPSTGLSRPDYHDWPAQLADEVRAREPEVFVLVFGANDGQGFVVNGEVYDFGTPRWRDEYRRRVATTMDILNRAGKPVVWVGQPNVSDPEFASRLLIMNTIYREEAGRRPGAVVYVDSWALFSDPRGSYAAYLPDDSGQMVLMRQSDGIHLTRAGGDRLATAVLRAIDAEVSAAGPPAAPGSG